MTKTPDELAQTMIDNLKEKTGKTLPQWQKELGKQKFAKHGEIVKHLKQVHSVTHGFANMIALKTLESGKPVVTDVDLVDMQYPSEKAVLRSIYESILKAVHKFGKDVEVAPKKSYVSLRRNKQFAIVQPSTKTRVDVGINCRSAKAGKRLEASGSFNSMVSHRVRLQLVADVDTELIKWLRDAYDDA